MTADNTAVAASTQTLVANTNYKVNLTTDFRRVELIHHGNVTNAVYYGAATSEADLPTLAGGGADEEKVLLSGERLTVGLGRGDTWIILRSDGTARVSVEGITTHDG